MPVKTGREDQAVYASQVANQQAAQIYTGAKSVTPPSRQPTRESEASVVKGVKETVIIPEEKPPEYIMYGQGSLGLGLTIVEPYAEAPPELRAKAVRVESLNPEAVAATGLGAATAVGVGVTIPVLGAGGLAAAGAGEAVKVGVAGKHLTVEEAVSLVGIGEIVTGGALLVNQRFVQPRASAYLSQKYLETGKLGVFDKAVMKITGAQSPVKEYIVSEPKAGEGVFSDENMSAFVEQHRVKTATGKIAETTEQKASAQKWVENTLWEKPSNFRSTLNEYIGSGQKQVLLMKSVQAEKMVPFAKAATLPVLKVSAVVTPVKYTPAVVLGVAKWQPTEVLTVQKNPFLTYKGQPYYRAARVLETTEYTVLSYPAYSRAVSMQKMLQSFTVKPLVSTKVTGKVSMVSLQKQASVQTQISNVAQAIIPTQKQVQSPSQITRQIQNQIQVQKQQTQQFQRQLPKIPQIPLGGGSMNPSRFSRFWGRWYPRTHKVKTWEQQLRTFGFKAPKALRGKGKSEVPSLGLPRFGKSLNIGGNKRAKRRRRKR